MERIYSDDVKELINKIEILRRTVENISRPPEQVILDDIDLCAFLKVSRRTTSYWREKGEITYSKLGGKIYYRLSDILRFMEKHRIQAIESRI